MKITIPSTVVGFVKELLPNTAWSTFGIEGADKHII